MCFKLLNDGHTGGFFLKILKRRQSTGEYIKLEVWYVVSNFYLKKFITKQCFNIKRLRGLNNSILKVKGNITKFNIQRRFTMPRPIYISL